MQIELRPEIEEFINDQVRTGRFSSAGAVIEAAISDLSESESSAVLTAEDLEAIAESDAQADRGEETELSELRKEMETYLSAYRQ